MTTLSTYRLFWSLPTRSGRCGGIDFARFSLIYWRSVAATLKSHTVLTPPGLACASITLWMRPLTGVRSLPCLPPSQLRQMSSLTIADHLAVGCRVCMEPTRNGVVLCSRCYLVADPKCAGIILAASDH
ncbi:hypothetical protein BJV74DRAFT_873353 [Russula compacta]|nr:hypothetical protein BJV74DRAFT_873353 [Russula compacta]